MKKKQYYLTFDMDWAIDEVLEDFCCLLRACDVTGTLHVTHNTPVLESIRQEKRLELGIHPNYNPQLLGTGGGNVSSVLSALKSIVPEAKCLRSHALTSSSIIGKEYENFGIECELNMLVNVRDGMRLMPYRAPLGEYTVIPFIYEDDVYLAGNSLKNPSDYFSNQFEAPRIFNFHPIHLYLNTDCMETYEKARPCFKNSDKLLEMKNKENYGIRDFFKELVFYANENNWQSFKISEGQWL